MSGSYQTLFERLGGTVKVRGVTNEFNQRFVHDEVLMEQFADVKMSLLKIHQFLFLKLAFAETPVAMTVVPEQEELMLLQQHRRLFLEKGLNEEHFDRIVEHMAASLRDCHVAEELVLDAVAQLAPMRMVFVDGTEKCQTLPLLSDAATASSDHHHHDLAVVDELHCNVDGHDVDHAADHQSKRRPNMFQRIKGSAALRRFSAHAA